MWKTVRKLIVNFFKIDHTSSSDNIVHQHEDALMRAENIKVKKDFVQLQQECLIAGVFRAQQEALVQSQLKKLVEADSQLTQCKDAHKDIVSQMTVWVQNAGSLQDKLTTLQGHVKVLESVLNESNNTIEALNLALELHEKEDTEGLQSYIDELETEIDEVITLIQKYGLQIGRM